MAVNFTYNYALIDLNTRKCIQVTTMPRYVERDDIIPIPAYDERYLGKFYIDGVWYERIYEETWPGTDVPNPGGPYHDIVWEH